MRQPTPSTLRQIAAAVVLVLSLAGCGGGGSEDAAEKPRSKPTPSPKATLTETCSKVDAAIERIGWPMVPTPKQADRLTAAFQEIAETGDEESRAALALVRDPITAIAERYPEPGMESINASEDLDGGLLALMDRCRAAGSTALE